MSRVSLKDWMLLFFTERVFDKNNILIEMKNSKYHAIRTAPKSSSIDFHKHSKDIHVT